MSSAASRDRFVLDARPQRPVHDPWRYQDVIVEDERSADGRLARTATVFLTGRECPWRCVMCDLWRFTIEVDTPAGAIPAQIRAARERLSREDPTVTVLKLYNAGSFFDPRAMPEHDYDAVAEAVAGCSQLVVESHPALVGPRVDRLLAALRRSAGGGSPARLEVAMGLETAHPQALERLHKQMTVDAFRQAAAALIGRGVSVRAFLLITPPFIATGEQDAWLMTSVETAFDCGASAVTLIPTRGGNGAMEALAAAGSFQPPTLDDIERSAALAHASVNGRGRLFVDLWDLERFSRCPVCLAARRERLHGMNLEQRIPASIICTCREA